MAEQELKDLRESRFAPHQERVIAEKSDLDEKIQKLGEFQAGERWSTVNPDEQERLSRQLGVMQQYSQILVELIAAF